MKWKPGRKTLFLFIIEMGVLSVHDVNGNVLFKTEQATSDVNGSQGAAPAFLVGVARRWAYTYNTFGQVLTLDGPRTDVVDKTT